MYIWSNSNPLFLNIESKFMLCITISWDRNLESIVHSRVISIVHSLKKLNGHNVHSPCHYQLAMHRVWNKYTHTLQMFNFFQN